MENVKVDPTLIESKNEILEFILNQIKEESQPTTNYSRMHHRHSRTIEWKGVKS